MVEGKNNVNVAPNLRFGTQSNHGDSGSSSQEDRRRTRSPPIRFEDYTNDVQNDLDPYSFLAAWDSPPVSRAGVYEGSCSDFLMFYRDARTYPLFLLYVQDELLILGTSLEASECQHDIVFQLRTFEHLSRSFPTQVPDILPGVRLDTSGGLKLKHLNQYRPAKLRTFSRFRENKYRPKKLSSGQNNFPILESEDTFDGEPCPTPSSCFGRERLTM